jgi:aspartate-semialdehyde dehydrogenase
VTRLALLSPTTLLGRELIDKLDARPDLWRDVALLSLADDEVGALTDAAGGAAVVARAEPDAIAAADVLFVCGASATYREVLGHRSAESTVIFLDPIADEPEAIPVVAGVNLDQALPGRVLASPHPGVALLAHLLQPLVADGVRDAVATLVQPASLYDRAGLDELFTQASRLVSLQGQEPSELFGRQLAFNLYPARHPPAGLAARARQVLGVEEGKLPLAVHLLQGPIFHGFSALLYVHLRRELSADEVRQKLAASPLIELAAADAEGGDPLGPIDVAARDEVMVGAVERDPDGGVWIWAVMDNLTRGGASNAVEILDRIVGTPVH